MQRYRWVTLLASLAVVAIMTITLVTPATAGHLSGTTATYTLTGDFDEGSGINVTTASDEVKLDDTTTPFNFIWVAVSTKGTIVKIDTNTGVVLGEYRTAPAGMATDPSRTTVDTNGSVWATNRAEGGFVPAGAIAPGVPYNSSGMGSIVHVGLEENGQCVDRNGNGKIWVTGYNSRRVYRIDPTLGAIGGGGVPIGAEDFKTVDLLGNPYNYSDMTGSTLIGAPDNGTWTVVHDTGIIGVEWGKVSWNASVTGDGSLTVTAATSIDGVTFTAPQAVTSGADLTIADGQYIRISVSFSRASTGESPVLFDLTIAAVTAVCPPIPADQRPTSSPTPGGNLIVLSGDATLTVLRGETAAFNNLVGLSSPANVDLYFSKNETEGTEFPLGTHASGTELVFRITTPEGHTFKTGPGSRNGDGIIHANVVQINPTTFWVGWEDIFGGGDKDYDDVFFQVCGDLVINLPPDASASGPYEVNEGSDVTLDASGSTDPEGGSLTFEWDLDNDGAFDDASGPTASFHGDDGPSVHTVRVQVCDDIGNCAIASTTVTVHNVAPTVDSGADQTVLRNQLVSLAGTWTDPAEAFDNPYAWLWSTGASDAAASYGDTASDTTSFATEGIYVLTLTVTDKDGGVGSDTVAIEVLNQAPDCSSAGPSIGEIWPPNHQMVNISILGVTDADGDVVSILITSIFQDEKVLSPGAGSGNFAPDGAGVGTDTAQVRAERDGNPKTPGNGRVYHIGYTADDGHGGSCSGTVNVGVPHDQGKKGKPAVDDGPLYDSTVS